MSNFPVVFYLLISLFAPGGHAAKDWKKEFVYSQYLEDISTSKIKVNLLEDKKLLRESAGKMKLKGKVIVVNFFATWCPPCVKELPAFQKFYDHYKGENFSLLVVNAKELPQRVSHFIESRGFSFPVILGDETTVRHFQIETLPTTLIADHTGLVRYRIKGVRQWEDPRFLKFFDTLLSEVKE